jgi:hypothetical protein
MVKPEWEHVINIYSGMCNKPFTKKQIQNMLTYRKKNNMLQEWLDLKTAYSMWVVNHNFDKENSNENN